MARTGAKIGGIAAAVALFAGSAAQAATPCWRTSEVQAARVRQLQTMLMVATLRCRVAHVDIVADYDGFIAKQKIAINAANLLIKQHFANAGGQQADYDRFATSLANGFGDDETSAATCADAASLAHDGAAAADGGTLDAIASARLFPAMLAGGACDAPATPVTATVMAKAPVVMLVAIPPRPPAPVSLPVDVVAALVVMARFRDASAPVPTPLTGTTQVAAIGK